MIDQKITSGAEELVSKFYNTVGWEINDGITEDARRWEDLRENSRDYVRKCRLRVLRHIPANGEFLLDMACGPIQYKEYLEYSRNFTKRYCIDLSTSALELAKRKIGEHGVFLHGSFFDIPLQENFFDCSVSLHTIYHIDKDRQEEAVRKLLKVTKPGKPVIIVYGNPDTFLTSPTVQIINKIRISLIRVFTFPYRAVRKIIRVVNRYKPPVPSTEEPGLYYFLYPLRWWDRFTNVADIRMLPWRSFGSDDQKRLIPDNRSGKKMLEMLFKLEEKHPDFFVRHFQYPMIILTKRGDSVQ